MIPTAFYLGKYLPEGNYDMAVNAGICGSYKKELPPGTVVEVVEDFPAELGAEENGRFRTIFALGLDRPDEWPYREGKLTNAFPVNHPALERLKKVKGVTVSTLGRNADQLKMITDAFDPAAETMEGAAFLYCCLLQRIPSIQLRAVSNFVGEIDRNKWQVELAIGRLNDVLGDLVNK
jgi:futalosine hydrolase